MKNAAFLDEIVGLLIREWGVERVCAALEKTLSQPSLSSTVEANSSKAKPKAKLTPAEMVQRATVDFEKKQLLKELALKYEKKTFLATVGDVRQFLEMRGISSRSVRQRDDAFKLVLSVLELMPDRRLRLVIEQETQSSLSELGPLSDAIRQASAEIRPVNSEPVSESRPEKD